MIRVIPKVLMVFLSILSIMGSPGLFPPAIILAIALMCLSGLIALFGHIKLAIINLALTSIALGVSPVSDISSYYSALPAFLFLIPFIIGYGGLLIAISKVQNITGT